jgi:hypothetical protein
LVLNVCSKTDGVGTPSDQPALLYSNTLTEKNPPPLRLIDKRQAADLLGTSTRTIEREVSAGRLVKHKIRGCVRFLMADVLRLGRIITP